MNGAVIAAHFSRNARKPSSHVLDSSTSGMSPSQFLDPRYSSSLSASSGGSLASTIALHEPSIGRAISKRQRDMNDGDKEDVMTELRG